MWARRRSRTGCARSPGRAVVAAATLTALTTVCSAWRWRVAAQALGIGIGLPAAVGSYYRSLFLNSVLIGGVLGDVHRAVTHGRRSGDVVLGLRAVAWERLCGQVIQAVVTVVVLLTLPSPVRPVLPYVLAGVAVCRGCSRVCCAGREAHDRRGRSRLTRAARTVADDLRHGMLAPHVWPQLALASVLVVAGHTATFVIAARVAGSTAPLGELLVLLMVVQTATRDPPEHRRVGAEGRSRRLGLRRGRVRRGHRDHDRHSLCGAHADRSCPGRWPAAGRRRSPPSRPGTTGRVETTRSGAADVGGSS